MKKRRENERFLCDFRRIGEEARPWVLFVVEGEVAKGRRRFKAERSGRRYSSSHLLPYLSCSSYSQVVLLLASGHRGI